MATFREVWKHVTSQLAKAKSSRDRGDQKINQLLLRVADVENDMALKALHSFPQGLTAEKVEERLKEFGRNVVAHEKAIPAAVMLLSNFKNPFILVLLVLGVVSYLTDDIKGALVVSVMVIVSVIMRFVQEYRSSKAADALKAMVKTTATVTRQTKFDGIGLVSHKMDIPFDEVVTGDIIHISAGDMVPADIRLLSSKDLFISESALTGESMPIEKYDTLGNIKEKSVSVASESSQNILEKSNLCFLGTNVVSGSATGVVVATGESTLFGSLAKNIVGQRSLTSFDKGVNSVTWLLVRFMLVMVPIVFVLNGVLKGDWQEAFLFAIAVAVGLTPEMLPMVVTANLAKGAVTMSKIKVIVKRLNSIQNIGAMDILCTDKTGTLTQDKIILEEHLDINGEDDPRVLKYAYLNSFYQTGLKNLLDRAVLEHVETAHELSLTGKYEKIDEIPFDFIRKRMSVVVKKNNDEQVLICKGAVEEILELVDRVAIGRDIVAMTPDLKIQAKQLVRAKNENGCRVVAVAYRAEDPGKTTYSVSDEIKLILMGFIAFLDPPKETSAEALQLLKQHGIQVKILTGDNDIITRRVCKEVGLEIENLSLGADLEKLSDMELSELAQRTTVFAKLAPAQKARIVRALQAKGHTVGFLGDGINDAPALRDADVGISVDSATDIARESADIILLEKSLLVLEVGVLKGREVYGNIIKYIKMTASSNFGNVLSVLIASAFIPFLPMLPVQLLVQNLLYDFSQMALPWDQMDKEFLERPKKWEPRGIAKFMIFIGPLSSLFDVVTFAIMWYIFGARHAEHQAVFQTGWFVEGLLSQTLVVHMIRTQRVPFIQSVASWPVIAMTTVIVAVGVWLPFSAAGQTLGMVHLSSPYFWYLAGILLSYCILAQIVKAWYIRRFKQWL